MDNKLIQDKDIQAILKIGQEIHQEEKIKKGFGTDPEALSNEDQSWKHDEYYGWKNWFTWNVSLWIGNNRMLYSLARVSQNYNDFVFNLETSEELIRVRSKDGKAKAQIHETPDGVAWRNPYLSRKELDAMIQEIRLDVPGQGYNEE
jgi:hypothetical protein